MIASYYTIRGKDFSVEIDPIKLSFEVDTFLKIGVRKFYFPWTGIETGSFFSSSDVLQFANWVVDNYKDAEVSIVYQLQYEDLYHPPTFEDIETSIVLLGKFVSTKERLHGIFRRPHPWNGIPRINKIAELEKLACGWGDFTIEDKCGCLTVSSNTNIYSCPFCKRNKRKKWFGNADREEHVIGTIDRGIFRDIECEKCGIFPNAKNNGIKYISRG